MRDFQRVMIIGVFFLAAAAGRATALEEVVFPDQEAVVSMDFKDASLKDVLKIFSIQSGMNFVAAESVQDRKITLYLDQVSVKETMENIFKANSLTYDLDKKSNIFIVKNSGAPAVETELRIFVLNYATVPGSALAKLQTDTMGESGGLGCSSSSSESSEGGEEGGGTASGQGIIQAVKNMLSEYGSIVEDPRTNSLIIVEIPLRMQQIAQLIAQLDTPAVQVLLEVEMLDVSKNTVDKMGINWPETLASLDVTGSRITSFPFGGSANGNQQEWIFSSHDSPSGDWTFENLEGGQFAPSILTLIGANLTLDFLRSQTDTKFLARPKLLTLNNQTAEIRISTDEAISATTVTQAGGAGSSSTQVERTDTGVVLKVTPQVNIETGEVTMFIYPKVAEATTSSITIAGGSAKDPEERSTKTLVRVKDGETVVIGGLLRTEVTLQQTSLPILSKIPIIGALFRHKGGSTANPDKNRERELIVFITPHVIRDKPAALAAAVKVMPSREQDCAIGLDRNTAIKSALGNFDKK